MKYLITCLIILPLFSFAQQNTKTVNDFFREQIKKALNDKTGNQVCCKVIPDKQTAIAVAEPILFKIYGKDQIIGEKPYNINFIDGYWVLSGSLPVPAKNEDVVGGTFFIILSSKDGRVIRLIHGK